MEKIARGLGKSIGFFFERIYEHFTGRKFFNDKIAFYAGEPSKKQEQIASS